jgi:hypothetical protein
MNLETCTVLFHDCRSHFSPHRYLMFRTMSVTGVILASELLCEAEKLLATQSSLLNGKSVICANDTIAASAIDHGCVLACMHAFLCLITNVELLLNQGSSLILF